MNRKQTIYFIQVSLYIAEHRQELEEEGGKDKAQVDYSDSGVNKKHQKFIFEYWVFSQKSYLNM